MSSTATAARPTAKKRTTSFRKILLTTLKGTVAPAQFCVMDIEATQWSKIYALGFLDPQGGGPDGDGFYRFEGKHAARDFLRFFLQERFANIRCYAHNGGNYDFLFFLQYIVGELRAEGWVAEFTTLQSCAYMIELRNEAQYPGKVWRFVDSFRLMPIALDKLGAIFGTGRKVKIEISLQKGESKYDALGRPENRALMWKYNKQDCLVLHKSIAAFQTFLNGLGANMQTTAPGTAMDLFRRRFLSTDIHVNRHFEPCPELHLPPPYAPELPKIVPWVGGSFTLLPGHQYRIWPNIPGTNLPARIEEIDLKAPYGPDGPPELCRGCGHAFTRHFLYGGRTEIFRMRSKRKPGMPQHLRYFDYNSHYPNCMLEPMPVGKARIFEKGESDSEAAIWKRAESMIGFIDCKVYIPEDCYLPPLPIPIDGKLKFPVGTFSGYWTTAELSKLREVGGRIVEVNRQAWFEQRPIFTDYIRELYRLRDKSQPDYNEGMAFIAKLMMNSLFGKFGTREDRERLVAVGSEEAVQKQLLPYNFEADLWREKVHIEPDYLCPQISAYITSVARARLWTILNWVRENGGEVYYCDTDSIVTDIDLPAHLLGGELGKLKLEHLIHSAEFTRPKLYLIVCAGVGAVQEAWRKGRQQGIADLVSSHAAGKSGSDALCPCFFEWWHKEGRKADRIVGTWNGNALDEVVELWRGYHIRNKGFSAGLGGGRMDLAEWRRLTTMRVPASQRELTSKRFAKIRELALSATQEPRVSTTRKAIRTEYDKRTVCADGVDTRALILHDEPREKLGKTGTVRGGSQAPSRPRGFRPALQHSSQRDQQERPWVAKPLSPGRRSSATARRKGRPTAKTGRRKSPRSWS